MKYAPQSLVIVACTLLSLLITLLATTASILQGGFARIERQSLEEDVQQTLAAIADQLEQLAELAPKSTGANLAEGLTASAREDLDLHLLLNAEGRLVSGWIRDAASQAARTLEGAEPVLRDLRLKPGATSQRRGILLLDGRPLLLVLRAVPPQSEEDARPLLLAQGRFLDGPRLERLTRIIHHALELRLVSGDLPDDTASVLAELAANPPYFVQALGANRVAGYTLIRDLNDEPAILLRVEANRTMYQQGRTSMGYFTGVTVIFGAVFGLLAWCWRA